jgi:hypothetical protein
VPSRIGRTNEYEISVVVMRAAAAKPGGYVTLDELRTEIPHYIPLTPGDLEYSTTRPGECLWEQLLRNIQSHHRNPNNFIRRGYLEHIPGGGYAITDMGREFLKKLDSD